MNRRGFFAATVGALIAATMPRREVSRLVLIDVSPIDADSFRKFIDENEHVFRRIRKDVWSGKTDVGWSLNHR